METIFIILCIACFISVAYIVYRIYWIYHIYHSEPFIEQRSINTDTNNYVFISNSTGELDMDISQNFYIPPKTIIMWSGTNIPNGWKECDGSNGTPDLRGRFIVGYDSRDNDYNSIGNTAGSSTVILTTNELPSHSHTYAYEKPKGGSGFYHGKYWGENASTGVVSGTTGNNQPHENLPPYYTIKYLMKI